MSLERVLEAASPATKSKIESLLAKSSLPRPADPGIDHDPGMHKEVAIVPVADDEFEEPGLEQKHHTTAFRVSSSHQTCNWQQNMLYTGG